MSESESQSNRTKNQLGSGHQIGGKINGKFDMNSRHKLLHFFPIYILEISVEKVSHWDICSRMPPILISPS
jgi:hypothetical protein